MVRGCIPGRSFKMTALDSEGTVLGVADRFPRFFNACRNRKAPEPAFRVRGAAVKRTVVR